MYIFEKFEIENKVMMVEYQLLKMFCLYLNVYCYELMYIQNFGNVLIELNGLVQFLVVNYK